MLLYSGIHVDKAGTLLLVDCTVLYTRVVYPWGAPLYTRVLPRILRIAMCPFAYTYIMCQKWDIITTIMLWMYT